MEKGYLYPKAFEPLIFLRTIWDIPVKAYMVGDGASYFKYGNLSSRSFGAKLETLLVKGTICKLVLRIWFRIMAGCDLNHGFLRLQILACSRFRVLMKLKWTCHNGVILMVVWFSYGIPRHAFHLWLVMRNALKTQDRVRQWDVGLNISLNLLQCMETVSPIFHDIISYLQPMAHRRTTKSIIGRILMAAASYFIWVERNNRLFKNVRRSPEELHDIIMVTVRLKLLTFRFKNTTMVNELLARWKMPKNFRLYG
ncbi:hypothetical protein Tco_1268432 [Tanacetum coccineum]